MMDDKAQISLEYLIIIAAALAIVAVVTYVLKSSSGGSAENLINATQTANQ